LHIINGPVRVVMIAQPINRVVINVAGPSWSAQPFGSKRQRAQGCGPEQALGPPAPFDHAFLSEALQIEVDPGTIRVSGCAAKTVSTPMPDV
jgi:hypothetical protein